MTEDTKKENIKPSGQRAWIVLESGHVVTYRVYLSIINHFLNTIKPVYKIDETVYYVMRDKYPA